EGEVLPHERATEGPFGEYTGYRSSSVGTPQPVYRVKAVTHRRNPILTVSCMGVPVDDAAATMHIRLNADLIETLRDRGFPVKTVYLPFECVNSLLVVSTKTPYPNIAKRIAHAVWGSQAGSHIYYVVVVDEDVDATNMSEVLHALATKCHPYRGIYRVPNAPVLPVVCTFLDPEDRPTGDNGAYALFDCTWPTRWRKEDTPVKASFDVLWPEDIQKKVLERWAEYGYK
ncbi:MAG: UbiD family decarboxylase, partial [Dehalococcoidia bacterium]|nr:UbiD family decarboxylase [Dehalococcoidia bacterium]